MTNVLSNPIVKALLKTIIVFAYVHLIVNTLVWIGSIIRRLRKTSPIVES